MQQWHDMNSPSPSHSLFPSRVHDMITITCTTSSCTNLAGTALHPLSLPFLSTPPFLSVSLFFPSHSLHKPIAVSSTQFKPRIHCGNGNNNGIEEEEEEEPCEVQCEVQVVSWRERRVKAQIPINADIHSVWNALTDYEHLADFIPNLVWSGRIPCPYPGRIWLEQRGFQRSMYWHIEARVVLDLQESIYSAWDRELHFSMVDGDFKKFEGKWSVKSGTRSSSTNLSYEVNVIPRFNFPAIFIERIIRSDLPVNLRALAYRVERNISENKKFPLPENQLHKTSSAISESSASKMNDVLGGSDKLLPRENMEGLASSISGSLSTSSSEVNINNWGVFGKVCRLDRPCVVDEVHLRRFDELLENGGVHRCVSASITVKAPIRDVWNVLSSYETLPEVVPNLAISKILSRDNNKVRILQEGCKGLLYMGKWTFEQLGNHHTRLKYSVESKMCKDTFLSEAIMEEVIYEDLPSNLCAIRDYVESKTASNILEASEKNTSSGQQIVPSAVGDYDSYSSADDFSDCNAQSLSQQRPKVPGLQRDIEVLKSELQKFVAEHGQEGFMPMRKQLRLLGRVDIEKAITRMGGFRKIATIMNLSLAYKHRKPKGYWDNLENLQDEISRFQRSWGMDPSFMPSRKSFERAGRFDIARALEKWGGLHQVSRLLSLKVRRQRSRQRNLAKKDKKVDQIASHDVDDVDSEIKTPSRHHQDTQKWHTELKQLDINWVE
ncbi:uncharacterized protein LOC113854243 isoform X2 [Abrus precatorius]|uniref:Uncharacterized protein LOC113854243 isoform X2 n=1 Tax=Abrus precatorius TaxID=3816 RepID=A0A8B8KAZ6_ABRPR|nr:uncharacterized protein LOC113854243 isoform X2 [Abrus precatorius]